MSTDATETVDYFATVAEIKADRKAMGIAVTNLGGTVMDQIELVQFWDSLSPALAESTHRRLTQAFMATFVMSRECGREKDILQAFIRTMALRQGWLKP